MQPLNAIDAITPAFTRTHEILFKPFRWGRSWKLAVTQYLGLMGAFFLPLPVFALLIPRSLSAGPNRLVMAGLLCIPMLLIFAFFYVGVRLQFVNFQMIVTGEQFVAPMWRRYGTRVWPFIGVKLVFGTVLGAVLTFALMPLIPPFVIGFLGMPRKMHPWGASDPTDLTIMHTFYTHLVGFYALSFLVFFLFKFASTLLEDLVLPFYILEEISLSAAFQRGFETFFVDPLQWILYFIMKVVLAVVGFVMQYISNLVVLIPIMIVLFLGIFLVALIPGASSHDHPGVGLIVVFAIVYILAFAPVFWYQTGSLGYLFMLLEAYSIYFLGGRYPRLGDLLEPPPPVMYQYAPPPAFPSAEERKDDDDDGPSLPMNPALA